MPRTGGQEGSWVQEPQLSPSIPPFVSPVFETHEIVPPSRLYGTDSVNLLARGQTALLRVLLRPDQRGTRYDADANCGESHSHTESLGVSVTENPRLAVPWE